ncbi:MAG: class I SAM-dependent methyltransferase [Ignavibacteria bacterium]
MLMQKYYDLLYKSKNYKKETDYILKFIRKYKPDAKSILDLGCGTGRHDLLFSRKGFNIPVLKSPKKCIQLPKKC